jgi:mono/diheme cytochrome c family protein
MTDSDRGRIFHWLLAGAAFFLVGAIIFALWDAGSDIDPTDQAQVAAGSHVYAAHCGSCHGANLEGQPNWRQRLPNGRMPAPPHDASGHTWHHPDAVLFGIVKEGMVPGKFAPPGYQSDMPAFAGILSDEKIRAVLAYIKSSWPDRQLAYQRQMDIRSRERR